MARPYSMDLRERAVARVQAGESVRFVARVLNISPSSVVKWSQRFKATGSPAAGKMGGYRPRVLVVSMPSFFRGESRKETSPCAPLWRSLLAAASKWTTGRSGPSFIVKA